VIVLDAYHVAEGETCRTTAHLSAVLDDRFFRLESLLGENGARLAAESHMAAINRIEAIVREEGISCNFERLDGYLAALSDDQREDFDKEREAARKAGFADLEAHTSVPVPGINMHAPVMRFPRQTTFHIMKYIKGLAKAFSDKGGRIYTHAHVREVQGGDKAYAKTDDGYTVSAKHIVVATNTPINDGGR